MFLYPWGDMHSINLGWFLLQFKEWVEKIQEYLDNGGGTAENLANVIAPVFNAANSYLTGDYVMYNDELYKANEAISPGTWDPSKWTRCLAMEEISSGAGIDNVARLMIAGNYSAYYGYQKYAICRYNDKLWMCNTNLPSGGEEWNPAHWDEITVGAGLTGLRRSVETLQIEIENLNSDNVANESENVPGDNVTDAIDNIQGQISLYVETGNTSTRAYVVGDYLVWKGTLYRVISPITSSGVTFTPNTNIIASSIGNELNTLVKTKGVLFGGISVTGENTIGSTTVPAGMWLMLIRAYCIAAGEVAITVNGGVTIHTTVQNASVYIYGFDIANYSEPTTVTFGTRWTDTTVGQLYVEFVPILEDRLTPII